MVEHIIEQANPSWKQSGKSSCPGISSCKLGTSLGKKEAGKEGGGLRGALTKIYLTAEYEHWINNKLYTCCCGSDALESNKIQIHIKYKLIKVFWIIDSKS